MQHRSKFRSTKNQVTKKIWAKYTKTAKNCHLYAPTFQKLFSSHLVHMAILLTFTIRSKTATEQIVLPVKKALRKPILLFESQKDSKKINTAKLR